MWDIVTHIQKLPTPMMRDRLSRQTPITSTLLPRYPKKINIIIYYYDVNIINIVIKFITKVIK
jgi:hypothetical protein